MLYVAALGFTVTRLKKPQNLIEKIPGQVYLWLAILIFGASSAVTRKLTEIGAQHLVGDRNPISLCNVLFVGNLCALLVLTLIYWRQWNQPNLQRISKRDWLVLTAVTILSGALAPAFIFQALALTNVNNIVLISRLEPPLTLALSAWWLQERVTRWEFIGAFVAFLGIVLSVVLQTPTQNIMKMGNFSIGVGEILTAIASIAIAISTIISKRYIFHIPIGIYSIYRNILGTAIFFFVALILYGNAHFMDVFSPFLWKWMLIYSAVIVVLGQIFWLRGFNSSPVSTVSLASSFTPVVSILAAYLILGEIPTQAQYIGGILVLLGIFLSQISNINKARKNKDSRITPTQIQQQSEAEMGFKGF
ncbi:MAG TPA: DMT family transporter [Nostocaceae cyanobacterium]|nr:DMT family transporter [Nostocaceae cyanobacterium]